MPDEPNENLLTLDVVRNGEEAVVRCHGKLVAGVNDTLYTQVSQLIPGSKRIVLDLTDLAYMDSMGLGTVVRLYVSAKSAGCDLKLINLGKRVRQLFSVTNMMSVFAITEDYDVPIHLPQPHADSNYLSGDKIGLFEILSLVEERLAGDLRERIGEAVAEIQSRRVAAFPKIEKRLPREMRLFHRDRFNNHSRPAEKNIALTSRVWLSLALNNDRQLYEIRRAHRTAVGCVDEFRVVRGFGLAKKNGHQRGCVQDHLGRPCSSYSNSAWSR
jgi:anti-sigma B factor antagonist